MKRPTFLHGVLLAAALGFFAAAVLAALTPFVGLGAMVRVMIPALALVYLLFLFSRSNERTGRVTTLSLWTLLTLVTWWFAPPLALYFLLHVGAVWLVRSLYFYSGVLPALLDLGLSALSVAASVWALSRSGSLFLATWCFFLVQALFVAIPPSVRQKASQPQDKLLVNDDFEQAKKRADAALRQLIAQ